MNRDQARRILEAKIALEAEIARPIYLVCREYIATWQRNSGSVTPTERMAHLARVEQVLRRHYARVVLVMTGRRPPSRPALEQAALSLRHLDSLRARAKTQAALILGGIDRDLARAAAEVASPAPDDGTENFAKGFDPGLETKDDPPRITAGYMMRFTYWAKSTIEKLKSRLPSIANVQTQGVAEESRQEDLFQVVPDAMANGAVTQTWRNMQDDFVRHPPRSRFDHVTPEGQTVPVTEPFEVSGELLRYPGDTGLGASLGNVIGCRCASSFEHLQPDGTTTEIYRTPHAPAKRTRRTGDRVGERMPATPTTVVTLNGKTRARVVLADAETIATVQQETPSTIVVRVRGETVARAGIDGGQLSGLDVKPNFRGLGIEDLLRRSVAHSANRNP